MKSMTGFVLSWTIGIAAVTLLCSSLFAQQPTGSQESERPMDTVVERVGAAEVRSVVVTGFFPTRQPVVYWHDPDWKIDLILPMTGRSPFSLRIRTKNKIELTVQLPQRAHQVNSIFRAPGDKAILGTDCDSECIGFVIVDLKQSKIIDDVVTSGTYFSPNRRFILYDNWFANWDDSVAHTYRLYDVLRTPRENTCGYEDNDPTHERLSDYLRGLQVYPEIRNHVLCDVEQTADGSIATHFKWSEDSSKATFDVDKGGVVTRVEVTMPASTTEPPRTQVH
jgi:hypothetical protein